MTKRSHRTLAIVYVLAAATSFSSAAAQTLSFGSAAPAATAGDSTAPKPVAKPDSMPKPEFKPTWNFNVWLIGAYTYQTDSATKAANSNNATSRFSVDRAYLTFAGKVAPDFGFRVTTDVKTLGAGAGYGGLIIRLKYAYLQWDYLHADETNAVTGWARIGQIHTVVIDDEERFWPRWLQKTALEYWGVQPASADEGAATLLQLPNKWGQFYFAIGNGGGYETAVDVDRYKDVAGRFDITPFSKSSGRLKTFTITPWYQIGETQSALAVPVIKAGLTNNAGGVFIGMNDPALTWGLEYGERSFKTQPVGPILTTDGVLKDGFIQVRPSLFNDPHGTPWGLVVRYDRWTASTTGVTPITDRTLWIIGAFLDVAKSSSFGITYTDDKGSSTVNLPQKTYVQLNWQVTF